MDLIDDLDTELVLAFLVEKRYWQKIDSREVVDLIGRLTELLDSRSRGQREIAYGEIDDVRSFRAH
jgi:hypothetical protein